MRFPTIDIKIYLRKEQGQEIDLIVGKEVLSATSEKDINNTSGGFSFDLRNDPKANWEDRISNGDFAVIKVNGLTKMQGLVMSVGFQSVIQKNRINNRLAVKVVDLGILFTKLGMFMTDYTWRLREGNIGITYFEAFKNIIAEWAFTAYDLKYIFELTWNEIIKAFIKSAITSKKKDIRDYYFSDNQTIDTKLDNMFFAVSNKFANAYPLGINIVDINYPNLWSLWQKCTNAPFHELYCDTVYKGQLIANFSGKSDRQVDTSFDPKKRGTSSRANEFETPLSKSHVRAPADMFAVIARPSPWLWNNFTSLLEGATELDPKGVVAVQATKSAGEIKSMYLVYPEGFIDPTAFKATGDVAVDERFLSTWGFAIDEVPLAFTARSDIRDVVKGLGGDLKAAFSKIDELYSGVVSSRYEDVRIGQGLYFPAKVNSNKRMGAMVASVRDEFDAASTKAITTVRFVHGEKS